MNKIYPFRIDTELVDQSEQVFAKLGINKATAIRMFLTRVVAEQRMPFDAGSIPNARTRKVIADTDAGKNVRRFKSVADLKKAIEQE